VRSKGSPGRSITVAVRLDPKLHHLAQLAARKQRRSLSSFLEWAVKRSLERISLGDNGTSLADEAAWLWDEEEEDRLIRLALRHPDMLIYDEQIIWKRLLEQLAE
jgi:hypothetical protein